MKVQSMLMLCQDNDTCQTTTPGVASRRNWIPNPKGWLNWTTMLLDLNLQSEKQLDLCEEKGIGNR